MAYQINFVNGEVKKVLNFFKKKEVIESDEYRKLKKEIIDLSSEVSQMESLLFKMGNDIKNLRGVLKKKMFDNVIDENQETKGLNNTVLLPDNG